MRRALRFLIVPFLAAACTTGGMPGAASSSATPSPSTTGTLFVVGGGPQPESLVRRFVSLAGGPGRARIVVMAMASASGERSGEEKAAQLRSMGAEARNLWFARPRADDDSLVKMIEGATAVWFGGGDQNRLAAVLRGSRVLEALQRRFRTAGLVLGGTSAGAAVLSTPMITGDERRIGGDRPPSDSSNAFLTIEADNVVTADGFGLLDEVIVDQHFVRRKRHNRLVSLVIERPPHLGAGIDESTALVVHPDGNWTVEGSSVVIVYDARNAVRARSRYALGATDIRMHVLTPGSRFDPRTSTARLTP